MIARTAALLIVLLAAATLHADEYEDRFVAQMRTAIQEREGQREELESHLKDLQAGRINRRMQQREVVTEARGRKRYVWNSPEAKEKAIAEVQAKISRLASESGMVPSLRYGSDLPIGMIGKLPVSEETQATTVLNDQLAFTGTRLRTYQYSVRQVIDENNALVEWKRSTHLFANRAPGSSSVLVWLTGPTDGLIDGSQLGIGGGIYKVTGTRQYETAAGSSKTVFVLEPFDASKLIEKAKQPAPQPR